MQSLKICLYISTNFIKPKGNVLTVNNKTLTFEQIGKHLYWAYNLKIIFNIKTESLAIWRTKSKTADRAELLNPLQNPHKISRLHLNYTS